jgi:hypothetical protein
VAVTLLKTVQAVDPATRRQTIAVLPASFVQQFPKHALEIHQPALDSLKDLAQGDRYKLVHHSGSVRVSIPRSFLQNVAATSADQLELWGCSDYPNRILVRVASHGLAPNPEDFKYAGE